MLLKNKYLCSWLLILWLSGWFWASFEPQRGLAEESMPASTFLERAPGGAFELRLMSWNVWDNSILPPDGLRHECFARMVKAVHPDVLCLQEIEPGSAAGKLAGLMDRLLPLQAGRPWQAHYGTNLDVVVLSRYPLVRRAHEAVIPRPIPMFPGLYLGQVMCLVDLPDALSFPDVYVITTHFISRSTETNMRARQRQADAIVRWLRTLRQPGHTNSLPDRIPIVILGDLNVYESEPRDAAHHLTTLLTGNIVDETTYGPSFKPDWDDTYLWEVKPRHNGREKDWFTWRSDADRFPPGALDRILYTDSVLEVRRSFVLNTTTMTEDELSRSGLLATDVLRGAKPGEFDHLPLVVDFAFRAR